jgi:hypothetical protein
MRIIEEKIYKFEELEKTVQEKVIDKWYEEKDYPLLYSDLKYDLKYDEKNIFDDDFRLYYSLSYCQGDGLRIEGDINLEKALTILFPKMKKKEKMFYIGAISIYSNGNSRYSYAAKSDIKMNDCFYNDEMESEEFDKKIEYFEENILPVIQDHYMDLCKSLENQGYSIIDYRMDIEEFTELCEAKNYEFYENGEMF